MYQSISLSEIINVASSLVKIPRSVLVNPKLKDGEVIFCMGRVCVHPSAYSCRYFEHCMGCLVIKAKDSGSLVLVWMPSRTGEKYYEADLGKAKSVKIVFENRRKATGQLVVHSREDNYKIFHFHEEGLDDLEKAFASWGLVQTKRSRKGNARPWKNEPAKKNGSLHHYSVVHAFPDGCRFHREEGAYPSLGRATFKRIQDGEGRVIDVLSMEKMLFFSGMDANVRSEVWPLVLGSYDYWMTTEEKREVREERWREYDAILAKKKSMTEEQMEEFYDRNGCIIERDVHRTDRTHPFFVGDKNTNVDVLREILEIYALRHPDLGYVQGMSDLLAPILYVVRDKVEALWCFQGAMDRSVLIQCRKSVNLDTQVMLLGELLKIFLPDFHRHAVSTENGRHFSYCHRWLIVNFKREFQEEDFLRIWEACWSMHETRHFNVFLCVAVLSVYGTDVVERDLDPDETLMHFNNLSMNMSADVVLKKARCLLHEFKRLSIVPCSLFDLCEPKDREALRHQIIECTGHPEGTSCPLL